MEEQPQKKKMAIICKNGRITKNKGRKQLQYPQSHTLFPLLLAAILSKSRNNQALVKKCLNHIILSLPHFLFAPVLSLIPTLLKSNCVEIVCKSAEIVGAASLSSFEMNEKIALEDEIIKSLISLLRSPMRKISTVACNAMLDLATASIGRQRLLQFSAIEKLILCSIQANKHYAPMVSASADVIIFEDDEYSASIFHVATTLINTCTMEQLRAIPTELSELYLVHLKNLWGIVNKQRFSISSSKGDLGKDFYTFNIATNKLVESIFRLSITSRLNLEPVAFDMIMESIFGLGETTFELFLSNIWEVSPMLVRNSAQASANEDGVFSPFIQFLGPKEAIPSFLPTILNRFTSCPPTASDELDILQVLEDVRNQLGCPLVYNQDVRVVKSACRKRELHYSQEHSGPGISVGRHILSIDDILKFEDAFLDGYSIALRGMELHFQTIASIADGLASLFGQPSAGVNLYLTPNNSQGLVRHSDDHCVFVCQLIGVKKWTIFPRLDHQLPRLYEPLDIPHDLQAESQITDVCQQFLLKEGDVLYIPRGFPHEARTLEDEEFNNPIEFSLHLTLAIEIEPPFEWEGFMHIAVYSWYEKQKIFLYMSPDSMPQNLLTVSVKLLHVAINLIGNSDPMFRKACLVGASSLTEDRFNNNWRTIFDFLVNRISNESKFSDILKHIEAALKENEDPLGHLRWMRHLAVEEEIEKSSNLSILSVDSMYLLDLSSQHWRVAEEVFMQVMSKFCKEVEFNDIEVRYKMLLQKYREVRKQYTHGMLSLHCSVNNDEIKPSKIM
ncbi:uncharacterized protein [Primulina huaijiensis]|uniref:uncharacterized protein isoform X1 n=2 Tax=Primulina huaijiensis TaxID=1492673 RepID=UPI003CC7329C